MASWERFPLETKDQTRAWFFEHTTGTPQHSSGAGQMLSPAPLSDRSGSAPDNDVNSLQRAYLASPMQAAQVKDRVFQPHLRPGHVREGDGYVGTDQAERVAIQGTQVNDTQAELPQGTANLDPRVVQQLRSTPVDSEQMARAKIVARGNQKLYF